MRLMSALLEKEPHVNFGRVINIRIDTTLKDILEVFRLGVEPIGHAGKMYVKKRWTIISNVLR